MMNDILPYIFGTAGLTGFINWLVVFISERKTRKADSSVKEDDAIKKLQGTVNALLDSNDTLVKEIIETRSLTIELNVKIKELTVRFDELKKQRASPPKPRKTKPNGTINKRITEQQPA